MGRYPFRFVISRKVIILFWITVFLLLFGIAFLAPALFYRITPAPDQKIPDVETFSIES